MCLSLLCIGMLSSCKSNNKLNRGMAGLTTKFNIHFNGEELYKESLKKMEENTANDDYSEQLDLHPVYSLVGKKEPSSSFSGAIDKCKKCVQTKSISNKPKRRQKNTPEYKLWLTRGEYNPYMHNAWLLTGRCQFYDGDFDAALATYNYTARHFWWKPLAIAECHIWSARVHTLQGNAYEAEAELELVIPHKQYQTLEQLRKIETFHQFPLSLQREFALAEAEILLSKPETKTEAVPYLKFARRGFHTDVQKVRSDFFVAQLHEETGHYDEAIRIYDHIPGRAHDYKTQFNARIAKVRVMAERAASGQGNTTGLSTSTRKQLQKVERKLNRMRWQARNEEYQDQIYAAMGDVSLMLQDTAKAIANYEKAVEKSTRGGMDKAMAALKLGKLTFQQEDYVKAQKAYATVMGIIKEDYKDYKEIKQLSSVLDELQTHDETVQLQDSLLHLASLDEEELFEVIDNIIKELKKKEKEEAEKAALAEYEERKGQNVDPLAQNTTQPVVGQQDKSWYFYNPSVINAGKSEFQRRWGSRKPEDDWRRKNKTETLAFNQEEELTSEEETTEDRTTDTSSDESGNPEGAQTNAPADSTAQEGPAVDEEKANDPHEREYYLRQIPRTEEEVANANQLIEDGLYNEGKIINEKLENFPLAIRTFARLEQRFPETAYRLEFYYANYLMCMRMNQPDEANLWRQKLIAAFPESNYGIALNDPNYLDNLRQMIAGQDSVYIKTYEAYLRSQTDSVHTAYYFVHDNWPLSDLMPKFLFLHALSYVQEGDKESFQAALEQLTATYPDADVSPLASLMVKGIHEGRDIQAGEVARGLMWGASLRQANDSTAAGGNDGFIDDDNVPHLLLIAYKTDSISQNDLLFEVAKFNFENYLTQDFDLEIIDSGGGLSVLVISQFSDLNALLNYHDRMDHSETIALPADIYMIDISEPNFRALLGGKSFQEYFDWVDRTYNGVTDTEEEIEDGAPEVEAEF